MSEKLCALRKIGGGMSETVLWTNPSPTSAFSQQDITLSKALSNFDFVGVTFKSTKSYNLYTTTYMRVSEFETLLNTETANIFKAALSAGVAHSGGLTYVRRFYFVNDTTIGFTNCNVVNYNPTINNDLCIPTQIIGLK